ncbi:MAG: glycosyl transferase, partial [Gammaproteobacteria bacterium]|nr:glycosyl transferase [Gammaproteobacteria bacterium]
IVLSGHHPMLRVVERLINLRSRLSGIATGDQGIFVTRELFQHIGGMPQQPLMEDVALSRRLKRIGRPACLSQRLLTSSRRWEQHGIVRTILLMWWLRAAYAAGVSPQRLARWYR